MSNYAYLVMVNGTSNNNKFYEITENADYSIDVKYGRIGVTSMEKHYPPYSKNFYVLLDEKTRKGYEDVTALHSEINSASNSALTEKTMYKPVDDPSVQELMDLLIQSSREFMNTNYTVTAKDITPKMVEEAEKDLNELNRIASNQSSSSLYYFNQKLEQLFTDVPRKMKQVKDYTAKSEADFGRIIQRETDMLDNIKGIIKIEKQVDTKENKDQTVLEAHGLDIRPVTYKEEDQITAHLGQDYNGKSVENRYVRAFAVENHETRAAYEQYKKDHNMSPKDVRLFYHGSKVENFYSIVKQGLLLNPKATITGKMFGQGLYFAPECRKSLNYMDVKGAHWNSGHRETGYCAIYAVALGKCYKPDHILGSDFRSSDLPKGTDSVFASKKDPRLGLRNDEYIVYNQDACTIKYLMEMSSEYVKEKVYNIDRNILRNNLAKGLDSLIKTPEGFKTELTVENLDSVVQAEILAKVTDDYNYDHLFMNYNAKRDTISFSIDNTNGECLDIYPSALTKDDYAFLSREMKKAFAESENEWKEIVKSSQDYSVGHVFSKSETTKPQKKDVKEGDTNDRSL